MKVSVLFTQKNSVYNSLNVVAYDINKNALSFDFSSPVVAHPPCRLFSRLRSFSNARSSEKNLAYWAIDTIRTVGGVLEHPFPSKLWHEYNLPLPGHGVDSYGGFSLLIYQSWFGHFATKKTLVYICGLKPNEVPKYPLSFDLVEHSVCHSKYRSGQKSKLKPIPKSARSYTPLNFALWLIDIAKICKV